MTTRVATETRDRALPIPGGIAAGGRRGWIVAVIAGAIQGAGTMVVPALMGPEDAFGFLAILLGMIGAVYLGFVLVDGRLREFRLEYIGLVVFTACAVIGLSMGEALVLATGYFGHAAWDAVHHPRGIHTTIPWWYVPLCLGFDVVVGIYVLVRFL